ncbi:MAG: hypothetical protein GY714_18280 [Desulfobacterales bacterium]|nr:hypothetical protein [Desulfobacterales bacterium]
MKEKICFGKTKAEIPRCETCDLLGYCAPRKEFDRTCEAGYNYKLATEEEIPSEYEWVKERFNALTLNIEDFDNEDDIVLGVEYAKHKKWLEENKPSKWEQCTRENTKVGDTVRHPSGIDKPMIIEHIVRESDYCSVYYPEENRTVFNFALKSLQINTQGE